jgi:hypothetical protein
MDKVSCNELLRKAALAISPVHDKPLTELLQLTVFENVSAGTYFCQAGDYSQYLAFICQGLFRSFYRDTRKNEYTTGFYADHMFMLPLPAFLYRKPNFQFFQALKDSTILKIKYPDIEALARKHPSVYAFLRTLIDREWIIKKELLIAGKYVYNPQTRYQLFMEQFREQVSQIPVAYISSYLDIPEKQLMKLMGNTE